MLKKVALALGVLLVLSVSSLFAADGAALFKAKCAGCHGPDGAAQTAVGKNLKIRGFGEADVQKMSDADLAKMIEEGKGKMPAFKGKLTGEDITALVKQIRSFKK